NHYPVSESYVPNLLSLPMYAELTEKEIRYVARVIHENPFCP
ncbi:TPA: erythromycin biosynthesis sensory transduction protein eryC1, partial [Patescibacteria group bacterium]|nr:erythromycin biosynthesis sensory transduction protein eryC1 [Patescibacteria group bacterium]